MSTNGRIARLERSVIKPAENTITVNWDMPSAKRQAEIDALIAKGASLRDAMVKTREQLQPGDHIIYANDYL